MSDDRDKPKNIYDDIYSRYGRYGDDGRIPPVQPVESTPPTAEFGQIDESVIHAHYQQSQQSQPPPDPTIPVEPVAPPHPAFAEEETPRPGCAHCGDYFSDSHHCGLGRRRGGVIDAAPHPGSRPTNAGGGADNVDKRCDVDKHERNIGNNHLFDFDVGKQHHPHNYLGIGGGGSVPQTCVGCGAKSDRV